MNWILLCLLLVASIAFKPSFYRGSINTNYYPQVIPSGELSSKQNPPQVPSTSNIATGSIANAKRPELISKRPFPSKIPLGSTKENDIPKVGSKAPLKVHIARKNDEPKPESRKCFNICMEKIKDKRIKTCKRAYFVGGLIRRCSIRKFKGKCSSLCSHGRKFCSTKCKQSFCGGKGIKICTSLCTYGKDCRHNCLWENEKSCILHRFPARFVPKCNFILRQKTFKTCFKKCSKNIKVKSCSTICQNIQVPKRVKKCLKLLVHKERVIKKCSVIGFHNECKNLCLKKKKICKKICKKDKCGGKVVNICSIKCQPSPECHLKCSLKKQIKCLHERIPAEFKTVCQDTFKVQNVKKCFHRCHSRHVVLPFKHAF